MSDVRHEIRTYVLANVLRSDDPLALPDDLDMVQAGVLSSLPLMKLVTFVETHFGIEVGVSDPREHFTSVDELVAYIDTRRAAAGHGE